MRLEEAIEKADKNENVKKLRGYFLGSIFTSLTEERNFKDWTLLYYNPRIKGVVDCFVNEKFVTVGEETPAIKEMEELDVKDVLIEADEALETAEKRFDKRIINILISLHKKSFNEKSCTVWTIGFVTPDIAVTSFDIDAANGQILREETTRLIKRL